MQTSTAPTPAPAAPTTELPTVVPATVADAEGTADAAETADASGAADAADATIAHRVVAWQRVHGRHALPWQRSRDPYRVWLSEVMLQQTQVATVVGYYERFVARFPTVAALAAAPQDDVLASWSGLGYYSRARNLHRCAGVVVAEHGGEFPRSSAALARLPGIGRSTAAAIAAFCFGERAAILDGNVRRVVARAVGFDGDLSSAAATRRLWAIAESLLPRSDVDVYTQGLMDLGATVCTSRRPACPACPLADGCVARAAAAVDRYPVKSRRSARGARENALLWLEHRGRWWLVKRPQQGVWAGLWTLPEYASRESLQSATAGWEGQGRWLPPLRHALTHFDWTLHPLSWRLPATAADAPQRFGTHEGRWETPKTALSLGLPAPVRRLFETAAVS